jgi:hypothetical protein
MDYKIVLIKLPIMKRNIFNLKKAVLAIAIMMLSLSAAASPGEPLIRLFNNTFPDAKDIRWMEEKEYHIVSFTLNNTLYRIWYDKKDRFVYSLRYCQENELPMPVLLAIKKKHRDKQIKGVTEITTQQDVTYELILSDNNKWYVAHITAYGEILLKYTFRKQE